MTEFEKMEVLKKDAHVREMLSCAKLHEVVEGV